MVAHANDGHVRKKHTIKTTKREIGNTTWVMAKQTRIFIFVGREVWDDRKEEDVKGKSRMELYHFTYYIDQIINYVTRLDDRETVYT